MRPSADIASVSTFYDRLGKPEPGASLLKIKNGQLLNPQRETSVAILMSPAELAENVIKSGGKLVQFTDRPVTRYGSTQDW
jgi:hypothetical protein